VGGDFVEWLKRLESLLLGLKKPQAEWLSIKGAAAVMGLSPDYVRRAVIGGVLASSNVGTPDRPCYRISRGAIAAFMKEREAGPRAGPRKVAKPKPLRVSPHFPKSAASL
jgi:hypothetical protein